ncbi:MAG: hypothetical protein R3Y53_01435 [Bacillota bacterium]
MLANTLPLICACFLIVSLIANPEIMLLSASDSITLFLTKVFPSLFPFMVACGIFMGSKGVSLLSKLCTPIMYPLFRLPGIASLPFFLGMLSGYPMGAKLTATLYKENKISLEDAEHLLGFSNNAGPLFLIGTVGTAFFHDPEIGYLLLISTILGAITTGILLGIFKKKSHCTSSTPPVPSPQKNFSDLLGKTIEDSLHTILQIGGYLVFFATLLTAIKSMPYNFLDHSPPFFQGIFSGILEITTGTYELSQCTTTPKIAVYTASCMIVSFGGCSILGQTFGILKAVPIKKSHYILSKICNSLCSGCIFYCIFLHYEKSLLPVFANEQMAINYQKYGILNSFFLLQSVVYLAIYISFLLRKKTKK